ncbi:FCD domain-containing protein [Brevundimonas aurifodinae]|uniref:FCD domain-containing protein n=1 Tax=Brevundimonas aurifodinae TaxID=1508312 RepID=A0ABV1NL36_9CAUL
MAIITLAEIQSEFEIRASLMGLASRLACLNGTDTAIQAIIDELDTVLALIEDGTAGRRLLEEGARLTRAILEAAGNAHVTDMVESAYRRAAWHYAQVGRDMPVYIDRVGACWQKARAAFLARDGDAVDAAARESVHVVQAETLRRLVASGYAPDPSRSARAAPQRATRR